MISFQLSQLESFCLVLCCVHAQVEERFVLFGAGLANIGMPPGQSSLIAVYGPNCTEVITINN